MARADRFDDENHGPLESVVRQDLAEIGRDGTLSDSYAEICFNLARRLDNNAGMASAAIAKELRETLQVIEEAAGDDDSADFFASLRDAMPTSVRNAT